VAADGDPEDDLFAKAMRGVRPVRKTTRIRPSSPAPAAKPPSGPVHKAPAPPVSDHAPVAGEAPWTLCASGVSRERLRRLAGEPVECEIDLHGHTRDGALRALETAIMAALADGRRTLCIVHGRGLHSQGRPVLKQAVFQWLREGPCAGCVLAAVPRIGSGGGASTILLRRQGRR
jgi:DNA-nicking Smr family endonuclease